MITDPGQSTFVKDSTVSEEAFDRENSRLAKAGLRQAKGIFLEGAQRDEGGNGKKHPKAVEETEEQYPAVVPVEPGRRPRREEDLEFIADSPEYLTQTIDATGWREKLEQTFQEAMARVKGA